MCQTRCAGRSIKGCYVTVSWKIRGGKNGNLIREEQRTVNCNCGPALCGDTCKALLGTSLAVIGICYTGVIGGILGGGLIGAGAATQ